MTTEFTAWYAFDYVIGLIVCLALAAYGFYCSLAGSQFLAGSCCRIRNQPISQQRPYARAVEFAGDDSKIERHLWSYLVVPPTSVCSCPPPELPVIAPPNSTPRLSFGVNCFVTDPRHET